MVKRLFCKHRWKLIQPFFISKSEYGCVKCGKVRKVYSVNFKTWRFKREMKGETFE